MPDTPQGGRETGNTEPASDVRNEPSGDVVGEIESLSRRTGRLLFDGQWLTSEEVTRTHRRLKWQTVLVLLETAAVLLALAAVAYVLYGMVKNLGM